MPTSQPPTRSRTGLATILSLIALLAVTEAVVGFHLFPGSQWTVLIVAGVVLIAARALGLSWDDLGLARSQLRRGGLYGLVIVVAVTVIVAVALAIPATRELFLNERYNQFGPASLAALVFIPIQTVLGEEILFRGVLLGTLLRMATVRVALTVQSLLFGLWHVASSLHLTAGNAGLTDILDSGVVAATVGLLGAVVVTAAAGAVLGWLRLRSGSLLTPIALHWAMNGVGAIAAALAWHLTG